MRDKSKVLMEELNYPKSVIEKYGNEWERMLDELQASCTLQGSSVVPIEELAKLPVGNVLKMCITNNIFVKFRPKFVEGIE